jgi:hypothetical protein
MPVVLSVNDCLADRFYQHDWVGSASASANFRAK